MQITYASKTIQRLCDEAKHQRKQLGEKRAKRLKNRLNELRARDNVSQLQQQVSSVRILEIGDTHD